MRTRVLACALVGSLFLGCGRTNLLQSLGSTNDASDAPDTTATLGTNSSTRDAAAIQDASATPESGSTVDEAGAAACYVGQWTAAFSPAYCGGGVAVPPNNNGCGPSEYQVACGPATSSAVGNGCVLAPKNNNDWGGESNYCCPCLSADASAACADVDLSTYDRSCTKNADCAAIVVGVLCPGDCYCAGNATINADGQSRYEQALAPVALDYDCNCGASWPEPVCLRGVCTIPGNQ